MADVDGDVIGNSFFDPEIDGIPGQTLVVGFSDPELADSILLGVSNSTSTTGGGGATVVRQNPELTRSNP